MRGVHRIVACCGGCIQHQCHLIAQFGRMARGVLDTGRRIGGVFDAWLRFHCRRDAPGEKPLLGFGKTS
jgi:hypothetical protein